MNDDHFAIGETLIRYVHEIYAACECTQKSEKCLCFEDPYDLPCKCKRMIIVRQQIKAINTQY
ncbi:MAG: hypothetical protein ACNI26_06665 [Terasakiella sp.]|uniref:hypothetical protein n=1 Tax=unclassified Terasakiella TaxID=2614952 RepID=UPI003B001D11